MWQVGKQAVVSSINPKFSKFQHAFTIATLVAFLTLSGVVGITFVLMQDCTANCRWASNQHAAHPELQPPGRPTRGRRSETTLRAAVLAAARLWGASLTKWDQWFLLQVYPNSSSQSVRCHRSVLCGVADAGLEAVTGYL